MVNINSVLLTKKKARVFSWLAISCLAINGMLSTPAFAYPVQDHNPFINGIGFQACVQAKVKFGSTYSINPEEVTHLYAGQPLAPSVPGGQPGYTTTTHDQTLLKILNYNPQMFDQLALTIICNHATRKIYYGLSPADHAVYEAHDGHYTDAGLPMYPHDYHSAAFPKKAGDLEYGATEFVIDGVKHTVTNSDIQHFSPGLLASLAYLPQAKNRVFMPIAIPTPTGTTTVQIDVTDIAKLLMYFWGQADGGVTSAYYVKAGKPAKLCKSAFASEREGARALLGFLYAARVNMLDSADGDKGLLFANYFYHCFTEGEVAAGGGFGSSDFPTMAVITGLEYPKPAPGLENGNNGYLPAIVPGMYYTLAWGDGLVASAAYTVADYLKISHPTLSAKLFKTGDLHAERIMAVMINNKIGSKYIMPVAYSYNPQDIFDTSGKPVPFTTLFAQNKLKVHNDVNGKAPDGSYQIGTAYELWVYNALDWYAFRTGNANAQILTADIKVRAQKCIDNQGCPSSFNGTLDKFTQYFGHLVNHDGTAAIH